MTKISTPPIALDLSKFYLREVDSGDFEREVGSIIYELSFEQFRANYKNQPSIRFALIPSTVNIFQKYPIWSLNTPFNNLLHSNNLPLLQKSHDDCIMKIIYAMECLDSQ